MSCKIAKKKIQLHLPEAKELIEPDQVTISFLFTVLGHGQNDQLFYIYFQIHFLPGLGSTKQNSMLNSMLVDKDFLTWLLISCQPIRCQV